MRSRAEVSGRRMGAPGIGHRHLPERRAEDRSMSRLARVGGRARRRRRWQHGPDGAHRADSRRHRAHEPVARLRGPEDLRARPGHGDWVVSLDADEELEPRLVQEIQTALASCPPDVDGLVMPRKTRYLGRWITHGEWYPDDKLRVFRRDRGRARPTRCTSASRCPDGPSGCRGTSCTTRTTTSRITSGRSTSTRGSWRPRGVERAPGSRWAGFSRIRSGAPSGVRLAARVPGWHARG